MIDSTASRSRALGYEEWVMQHWHGAKALILDFGRTTCGSMVIIHTWTI